MLVAPPRLSFLDPFYGNGVNPVSRVDKVRSHSQTTTDTYMKGGCTMRRSTVIAKCLVNSDLITRLEDAEARVRGVFIDEFPQAGFNRWNREMDDRVAQRIIDNVGRASRINVKMFIEDLW